MTNICSTVMLLLFMVKNYVQSVAIYLKWAQLRRNGATWGQFRHCEKLLTVGGSAFSVNGAIVYIQCS